VPGESVSIAQTDAGANLEETAEVVAGPASRFPVEAFRAAADRRDIDAMAEVFTPDVLIRPIGTDHIRFEGQDLARELIRVVLSVSQEFEYTEQLLGHDRLGLLVDVRVAGLRMEGFDFMKIDEDGKCYEMVVMARPLPSVAVFVGRVAIGLASYAGWPRRLLMAALVAPLEISQRIAGRFAPWLIRSAVKAAARSKPGR
jgi:hypothetical protein